ncbi:MAG TPA: UDP-N-acetylmuramate:L-alanyl-gamma-D-glutamyl-meso-diaminopimelate ligase, partial [Blastocatellia bacterium]|nr:UDP-N-acetylmuramate:L-alanyl-gamma-D-glutamyl-meso-diaminopimelate ligase [Blastocatellia bacterium]
LFHPERYTAEAAISPVEMARKLRSLGREAEFIPSVDEIVSHLAARLEDNDVVVIMSNGSFGGIHDKLMRALSD